MSKEQIYAKLAMIYKKTCNEIADMTPYQQVSLYAPDNVGDTIEFSTYEDYLEWAMNR